MNWGSKTESGKGCTIRMFRKDAVAGKWPGALIVAGRMQIRTHSGCPEALPHAIAAKESVRPARMVDHRS